jgi:phosphate transport system permease protein
MTQPPFKQNLAGRKRLDRLFQIFCFSASCLCFLILAVILIPLFATGLQWLDWDFLTKYPSSRVENAGVKSAIVGTIYLMTIIAVTVLPLGVATAVYIEEFLPKKHFLTKLIRLNIRNLAGVPSIVFGILGLVVFVRFAGWGRSVLRLCALFPRAFG